MSSHAVSEEDLVGCTKGGWIGEPFEVSLPLFQVHSSCSLLCAVKGWMWLGGIFLCSETNDRSCSLEFPGWLYSAIRMRQSSWAESNAKMKGKVTFIQWECLR